MRDSTQLASECLSLRGLIPIPPTTIEFLSEIDFDVYTAGPRERAVLFCSREYRPRKGDWDSLRKQAGRLYIKPTDADRWRSQIRGGVEALLETDAVPPLRQFELLQALLDESLRATHGSAEVSQAIEQTQHFSPHLVRILGRGAAVPELFQILRHDFDTFSHVVNVASYCVLLARELGIREESELEKIAVGGLLHDFGKRDVPNRILLKRGPLTQQEREIVQQHPLWGYVAMQPRGDLEWGQLMMAYQHHERMDGSGYPVQILGNEIHPWGRLCAVCDVFEALTGERPYRKPMSLAEGLAFIQQHAGTQFDEEMVRCWTLAIA